MSVSSLYLWGKGRTSPHFSESCKILLLLPSRPIFQSLSLISKGYSCSGKRRVRTPGISTRRSDLSKGPGRFAHLTLPDP